MERPGGTKEYVCHVGHRLGLQSMTKDKTDVLERLMWTVVSQSEEFIDLLEQARQDFDPSVLGTLQGEVEARRQDVVTLRALLERRNGQSTRQLL